jgi:hypothetical protein
MTAWYRKGNYPIIFGSVEILFFLYSFILCGILENDPLFPPEGEAAQGEHPPAPPLFWDIFQPYLELLH